MIAPSPLQSPLGMLVLWLGLSWTGSLAGCHKTPPETVTPAPNEASVKRSLDEVRRELDRVKVRFRDLRQQVETVDPDAPGFSEVRARFFAVEEARGITDLRVKLLASRLASASTSGKPEELRQLSRELAETHDEIGQLDELHAGLQRRVRAFQAQAR